MLDERLFIAQVEAADARGLAQILSNPTAEKERALRIYFGDADYEAMHEASLRATSAGRGVAGFNLNSPSKGRVVVIHGIMGAQLGSFDSPAATTADLIWIHYWRIFRGWAERLRLDWDNGVSAFDVRAVGILKKYYGPLLLRLLKEIWDAHAFWFDWRKDLNEAARQLYDKIKEWYGDDKPVHLIAHSMGGLVARTFIRNYPERWKSMWDAANQNSPEGAQGGRLIMLGTPNYGSFLIPQVITGLELTVRLLDLLDTSHSFEEILQIVNSFPGSYQMLPSPFVSERMKPMAALYESKTYAGLSVPQDYLDRARAHHKLLRDVVDDERMIYIAGYDRLTPSFLKDPLKVALKDAYDVTDLGDGRVTHELGIPRMADGTLIKSLFYVDEDHANLPKNSAILESISQLLETGSAPSRKGLLKELPLEASRAIDNAAHQQELRARYLKEQQSKLESFSQLAIEIQTTRADEPTITVSQAERNLHLAFIEGAVDQMAKKNVRKPQSVREVKLVPVKIEIRLKWAKIEEVGTDADKASDEEESKLAVDAIAVGHYLGFGKPLMAEQKLDEAISRKLLGRAPEQELLETERLLTLFSYRGIIRGELGQPFFIDDPRSSDGRIIALAGMGEPGRFWVPELTVLSRELCWSLGRMGKRHLATVLIGSGQGNMTAPEAVNAWLRGLRYALTGSEQDQAWQLKRLTFVEVDPRKIKQIQDAILHFAKEEDARPVSEPRLKVNYREHVISSLKDNSGRTLEEEIELRVRWDVEKVVRGAADVNEEAPVHITLSLGGSKYRFGAMTATASVPEREVTVDPSLVKAANDMLPKIDTIEEQQQRGRHMESLLVPKDLRPAFSSDPPVVMMLDADTARIHWEMVSQPDPYTTQQDEGGGNEATDPYDLFLGMGRGFTRQLRTTFAPPPEPPPPPRRVLRVLVVADPWAENRLSGAEEEGKRIVEMFNAFNTVWNTPDNRIEVESLIGPNQATRVEVHYRLTSQSYDILHFAGHCKYVKEDPPASGWIFTGGETLSANELNRIDRIPKFVFSNACESGITPDRPERRSADLAPSFAEAFFARGVSNFVCTAWPVSDLAARLFALKLYGALLGLELREDGTYVRAKDVPVKMYQAMQMSRRGVAGTPSGIKTWGAYQHYGNPYLQFFDKSIFSESWG